MKVFLFRTIAILILLIISAGLYAGTLRGVKGNVDETTAGSLQSPGMPFESSHERAPYALILSIDRYKTVNLPENLAEFASPDVGLYRNKFFILFPPGVSLLGYPFYQLGKTYDLALLATYSMEMLFAVGCVVLLFLLAVDTLSLPIWIGFIVSILWAFGTTSWSYAITLYQHIPATFCLLLGLYAAWKYSKRKWTSLLWGSLVWISYGAGLFIDFPSAILMSPVMIYFVITSFGILKKKDQMQFEFRPVLLVTAVFFAILIGFHGYYNYVSFGDWKKFGQSFKRYEGKEKYAARLAQDEIDATQSAELKRPSSSNPFSIFKEERSVTGINTLTVADDKGLFFYSPVFLLAILSLFLIRRKWSAIHSVMVAVVIINLLAYGSFGDPWGGWAYGPRYLIPGMALLALFVGEFLSKIRFSIIGRIVFFLLFAYSSAIGLLGALTTNLIPPKVEGVYLGLQYNYIANIFYLFKGVTGSFFYRTYLSQFITLGEYYAILLGVVLFVVFFILSVETVSDIFARRELIEFTLLKKLYRTVRLRFKITI